MHAGAVVDQGSVVVEDGRSEGEGAGGQEAEDGVRGQGGGGG